jgi:hypothetical protein
MNIITYDRHVKCLLLLLSNFLRNLNMSTVLVQLSSIKFYGKPFSSYQVSSYIGGWNNINRLSKGL